MQNLAPDMTAAQKRSIGFFYEMDEVEAHGATIVQDESNEYFARFKGLTFQALMCGRDEIGWCIEYQNNDDHALRSLIEIARQFDSHLLNSFTFRGFIDARREGLKTQIVIQGIDVQFIHLNDDAIALLNLTRKSCAWTLDKDADNMMYNLYTEVD